MLTIVLLLNKDLLKETIVLGLWKDIFQYRELIPLLAIGIVKIEKQHLFRITKDSESKLKDEVVRENKKALLQKNPDIALRIDCKIKANEIIRLMNEL